MDHLFSVQIATNFDVETAILLNHMAFWIMKNAAEEKHYHDGLYWTYNSTKSFTKIFPYWSSDQINRLLRKCISNNLIVKGNYNKFSYDKTSWYSLTNESLCYFPILKTTIIPENTDCAKSPNGSGEIANTIPDSKHIYKNTISVSGDTPVTISTAEIINAYHEVLPECPKIKVVDRTLAGQITKMKKHWPKYQKDGKTFSIDSFKDYLNYIKEHFSWFIAPYTTPSGRVKQNNLRAFTREINITKIVNGEFSAT